jgi:sugar lactone lactonase YvrE
MKNKTLLVYLFLGLFTTSAVWSFTFIDNSNTGLPIKWPAGSSPFLIALGTSGTLSDGHTYNSSIQAAMTVWNNQLGSFQLQGQSVAPRAASDGNRVNEVVFSNTVFGRTFDSNILAVTTTWSAGNDRTESDILFNTAYSWDSYRGSVRSGAPDIQRVALHELGHALGLDHPDEDGQFVTAIMNSRVGNLNTLATDDIAGAQQLYGPPGVPANDDFSSAFAFALNNGSAQTTGFNTNATKQSGEPHHANDTGGRSVWWRWTAPASGSVTLGTQGSAFDTTLGVYTGSAVSALATIAFDDDLDDGVVQYSSLAFAAIGGVTYHFAVDGFDGDSGGIALNGTFTASSPEITAQPQSRSVYRNASATFAVTARIPGGSPTFTWHRDGTVLSVATSVTDLGSETYRGEITLLSVQPSDAGTYTVTISASSGSATSTPAILAALTPPADQAVTTGRSVSFHAGNGGSFQWQVSTNGGASWADLSDNSTYSGSATATLTISNPASTLSGARFRVLSTTGSVITPGASFLLTVAPALVPNPSGILAEGSGDLVVADSSLNTLQKISVGGIVSDFVGTSGQAGSTDATGVSARFNQPSSVIRAADLVTLFTSDIGNGAIRRIAADGAVTTFAGSPTLRGNNDAIGNAATFSSPIGLAFDTSGNLYVADEMNHTIRRISSAGTVSTFAGAAASPGAANGALLAARFNHPSGLAFDSSGNLYVTDTFNHTIRKISTLGLVTTFAGLEGVSGTSDGSGSAALFNKPTGITVDSTGNLYVADTANSAIRKITPAGVVSTFAGLSSISGLKDGMGNEAWFNQPLAVDFDASGNLYVADTGNAAIRKITPAGIVSTLTLGTASSPPTSNPSTPSAPSAASGGGGGGGAHSPLFLSALALLFVVRAFRR